MRFMIPTLRMSCSGLVLLMTVGSSMAQMGGMVAPPSAQPQPTEHGTKRVDGLEVTLLTAPPLSSAQMQQMMRNGGGMKGMGGMMGGQQGMAGMPGGVPTHWIGVIVRDLNDDRAVQDAAVTLTAKKDGVTRTVKLMPMPGSYGANVTLPERGRYTVTVIIGQGGQRREVAFPFDYQ